MCDTAQIIVYIHTTSHPNTNTLTCTGAHSHKHTLSHIHAERTHSHTHAHAHTHTGADWAQKPIGTAADKTGVKWVPKQKIPVTNPKPGGKRF